MTFVEAELPAALAFIQGSDAISALMRERDWRDSPLGSPMAWPQSLHSVVGLMLDSKFPMLIAWGRNSASFTTNHTPKSWAPSTRRPWAAASATSGRRYGLT